MRGTKLEKSYLTKNEAFKIAEIFPLTMNYKQEHLNFRTGEIRIAFLEIMFA